MTNDIRFISAGPLSVLTIILLVGLVVLFIPLLFLGIIGAAFTRLGLSWVAALVLVLLMLSGSFVNIPLYHIRRDVVRAVPVDSLGTGPAGSRAANPVWDTTISVNLGGGIIPVCIAAYMLYQGVAVATTAMFLPVSICAALVAALTFIFTRELAGVGIRVPFLIPALTALLTGMLLLGGTGLAAAVTALAGGVVGTLAGGNIARLLRIRDLDVTDVSIGGYGTFGPVFLCCILPALIA
jgi:uncharacterized membrane protein